MVVTDHSNIFNWRLSVQGCIIQTSSLVGLKLGAVAVKFLLKRAICRGLRGAR